MATALLILLTTLFPPLSCEAAGAEDGNLTAQTIAIVVGSSSMVRSVSKDALRDIYLRRQRLWSDGTRVVPINLPPSNPLRDSFTKRILGRSTADLMAYWNNRYFEGTTPPQVLNSSAAIRGFLAAEPGAIAYLPLADVDGSCRTLLLLTPDGERLPPNRDAGPDPSHAPN